jgi:hypothetical protein
MITILTPSIRTNFRRLLTSILILAMFVLPISIALPAGAAQITGRTMTLSNSAGAASGVTYTLTTDALPTATAVRSIKVEFCTALPGCSAPTGFSSAGSGTLPSQPSGLGSASGWTANTGDVNELRITHASNVTAPSGAVTITWNGVVNPTANNTTFYGIITTYSDAAWTTPIGDTGNVTLSTASAITVALAVYETLTFCAGTSITGQNCGTISGSTVTLPAGSVSATSFGTSVLSASTNATNGYAITFTGGALGPLTSLTGGSASIIGDSQFGFNLVANATPAVGAARTGTGTATAVNGYGTADSFKYAPGGAAIATVGAPTNGNTFTVSYIANIDGVTAPGNYQTTITYVATANF